MDIVKFNFFSKIFFVLAGIVCSMLPLSAQSVTWTGNEKSMLIGDQVEVLQDEAGQFSFEEVVAKLDEFVPSELKILNYGFVESSYWVRFSYENKTNQTILLEVANPLLSEMDFYFKNTSGEWQHMESGYEIPLSEKYFKHHNQLFPLTAPQSEIILRFKNNGRSIPIAIWNQETYEVKQTKQKIIYGIYMGIMIFVIFNNIFLFFSLQKPSYLHYSFLVFLYAFFSAVSDGYLSYVFPNLDLEFWFMMDPMVNTPNGILYCIFFLEASKYDRKMYKISLAVAILFIIYIFISYFLPHMTVSAINQMNALIAIILMTTIGVRTGRRGNRLGYYFALTYLIFFFICSIEIIYNVLGTPPYLFEVSHVSVGIFLEVFMLSYLLSKRFEWEKADIEKARFDAQQEVIQKTKENEKIVREQNIVLEQKVTERTHQLQEANEELNSSLLTVDQERQKSDALLLNILPEATAQELKENGSAAPQMYKSVTVLFTDFVDFTQNTENIEPQRLVSDLNECFIEFDKIVKKYGLEKIKTIGDAYMAAGGLPNPNHTHAKDAIEAALEMMDFINQWKQKKAMEENIEWKIRIGIHTGSVIAGVVGMHKFSYDIWGDAVNTASRMETNSEVGKINISADTYSLVKNDFDCTSRGKKHVKGKGELEMFWVNGKKNKND